jgi:hypothetical protein
MTEFESQICESAKSLGDYMIHHEFNGLIDETMASHWYFLREIGSDLDEVFEQHFLPWVKGYVYYSALVCICKDEAEVNTQLREDFDELYKTWQV